MPQTEIRAFRDANQAVPVWTWLEDLETREPRAYRKCLSLILLLSQQGNELRRPFVDMLRDGIRELRAKVGTVNYRILFFFCGQNVVCLSHGLTKEDVVPDGDIDAAVKRKKLVERDLDKYTAEWEI